MSNKINIEDLPENQQEYVREYQRILHGLADVQDSIRDLERRAHNYTEELKTLRAKEAATASPSFLSHLATVASVILSPRTGTKIFSLIFIQKPC